jgi:dihydroorotate dehydrogenase electron transfer subunit
MKKSVIDLTVTSVEKINERYVLIKLTDSLPLPEMLPGQFVEIRVDDSPSTFLRRPISINYLDRTHNALWLLVAAVGEGTRHLARLSPGDKLNCMLPLGNGFTLPLHRTDRYLLVGGGVGTAPMLFLGAKLKELGNEPTFLLGARSSKDLLELDLFEKIGRTFVTTEDATAGERGFVTDHSILASEKFDFISSCGPTPMMKSVARYAHANHISCEVSLENMMACGLGACLCCVEKTTKGNICVCKEGPVLNINQLLWQL